MTPTTTLPAAKRLTLGEIQPVLVVDTREQIPLEFARLQSTTGTLVSGDYSVQGLEHLFAVERKSVADLVGCCMGESRDRFERELHRLRGFQFKRLLIVGTRGEVERHQYRSNVQPKVVLHTLAAFEVRYDEPVVWAGTAEEAAQAVESWAWWFAREVVKSAVLLAKTSEEQP